MRDPENGTFVWNIIPRKHRSTTTFFTPHYGYSGLQFLVHVMSPFMVRKKKLVVERFFLGNISYNVPYSGSSTLKTRCMHYNNFNTILNNLYIVNGIKCFQCSSAHTIDCSDVMVNLDDSRLQPEECNYTHGAAYCIKSTALDG